MSSHPRSGGPPSLMDDVPDYDRNLNSNRFDSGRGGGRGGRGGGNGGMRGRGGGSDGGFGHRGGHRGGGRGDFHHRDRFHHGQNFHRSDDDQRGPPPKMPGLFDVNQGPPRSFDRDHGSSAPGRGRMPYARGGGGSGGHHISRDGSHDDRYRHSGPPSLLDFPKDQSSMSHNNSSNNSVPSLFSVSLDNPGASSSSSSDLNKPIDSHKDQHHDDGPHGRSEHQTHRDNDNRHRDRDSRKSNHGGYDRSSSLNRDRSRSPRDRDRNRHGSSRDERSFPSDYRRTGSTNNRGGHHYNNQRDSHTTRFGSDHNQGPWHDRRDGGGRSGNGRGSFHDRQHDMSGHHRSNEQLHPDNHPYSRDGRPNFDGPPPPLHPPHNRPFQEGNFSSGNFDPMGPPGHNRASNFNQGPSTTNRPDFYASSNNNNNNNSGYPPQNIRSGGRPSRFSNRHDDFEDDRPLTKPNLPLPNVPTTAPLYTNQPNNPTFSQPRQPLASTFSTQQAPPAMFPHGQGPSSQYPWSNQQTSGAPNSHVNQSSLHSGPNDQTNSSNNPYGSNAADFHRQSTTSNTNAYYPGAPPPGSSQVPNKLPTVNVPSMGLPQSQQNPNSGATQNPTAAANMNPVEYWQQYYQYCQAYQQQQQQQQSGVPTAVNPLAAYPWISQAQTQAASMTGVKPPTTNTTTNSQDATTSQGNVDAWTNYYIQCQAYLQQAQMANATSALPPGSVTIAAPSQLYQKPTGKP